MSGYDKIRADKLARAEAMGRGEFGYNPGQPRDPGGKWTAGEGAIFDGKAADGSVQGAMSVKIVDPWSNKHKVTHTTRGRHYEGNYPHIPQAIVERPAHGDRPAKQFPAFHHSLKKDNRYHG